MKKLLLLALCLGALAGRAQAQAAPPADIVVVRVYEDSRSVKTITIRGNNQSEALDFTNGWKEDQFQKSAAGYYSLLSGLYREGYVLQGTIAPSGVPFSGANGAQSGGFTTLLFVKKP